jgi:hypothetical protein
MRESVTRQTEDLRGILNGWRRPIAHLQDKETCFASISSPRSGFVAVVSVHGEPRLVVSLSGQLSNELESLVAACRLGNGVDVETSSVALEVVLQQLREWVERQSGSALAGLANSSTVGRRRLLERIDTAIEKAPPHSRGRRLSIAAKARRVAASQHSAAIEAELESLGDAPLSDDEWLAVVAKLDANRAAPEKARSAERGPVIQALLLLFGVE